MPPFFSAISNIDLQKSVPVMLLNPLFTKASPTSPVPQATSSTDTVPMSSLPMSLRVVTSSSPRWSAPGKSLHYTVFWDAFGTVEYHIDIFCNLVQREILCQDIFAHDNTFNRGIGPFAIRFIKPVNWTIHRLGLYCICSSHTFELGVWFVRT